MTTTTHRPVAARRVAPQPTLWIGLATSAGVTAATVLGLGSLEAHLRQVYEPYGVGWQGARTAMAATLLTLGIAGMAGWLLTARLATTRPTGAAILGTMLFLVGLAGSLTLVTAREYDQLLVPTWLGLLDLLPAVVGLVAVTQLWRRILKFRRDR